MVKNGEKKNNIQHSDLGNQYLSGCFQHHLKLKWIVVECQQFGKNSILNVQLCAFSKCTDMVSHNLFQIPQWEMNVISLFSTGLLCEYPGNWLISAHVNARIVYRAMEPPLRMSRHPQRPVTVQQLWVRCSRTLRMCVQHCMCVWHRHRGQQHMHYASLTNIRKEITMDALPRTMP